MHAYKVSDAKGTRDVVIASNMTEAAETFFGVPATDGLRVWFTGKVDINGVYAGRVMTIKGKE